MTYDISSHAWDVAVQRWTTLSSMRSSLIFSFPSPLRGAKFTVMDWAPYCLEITVLLRDLQRWMYTRDYRRTPAHPRCRSSQSARRCSCTRTPPWGTQCWSATPPARATCSCWASSRCAARTRWCCWRGTRRQTTPPSGGAVRPRACGCCVLRVDTHAKPGRALIGVRIRWLNLLYCSQTPNQRALLHPVTPSDPRT